MTTLIKDMDFPRSFNHNIWKNYLQRPLLTEEFFILENAKSEKHFNETLEEIHNIGLNKGLYISYLTKLHGNCLFESLIDYGIGSSVESLREAMSYLLYIYGDYKSFFETQEETIKELFLFSNEIEYVYCPEENAFYKYTFDVMCQDMANDNSWTRLPTQLFLMVISKLYNTEIVIIHDSGYESVINTNKNAINQIHLGLMGESHYIPLKKINENTDISPPRYNDAKIAFFIWAVKMWNNLNNSEQEESSKDESIKETNIDDFVSINVSQNQDDKPNELFVNFN
jgi:hypothetical protein